MNLGGGEGGEALAREHELVADGAAYAGVEGLDALLDAVLRGGDEFGGGGGSGGAQVGDEVRDGEVSLVADGGDGGKRRGGDGAGEGFVVEAGEVFDGAAAAGDEDEVDAVRVGVEEADAGDNGGGASGALNGGGIDEQIEARMAAAR